MTGTTPVPDPTQPECRSVRTAAVIDGVEYEYLVLEHDGPCVFVDHQCSCGRLDVGIIEGDGS
jgi:hypothetical protein